MRLKNQKKYQVWVVNTASESQLYLWDNWKRLLPLLDELVSLFPGKAFIRTAQGSQQRSSLLGFGRMAWNRENNEKWTKKYRSSESESELVSFYNTEIWVPDWNEFDRTGMPPDLFVQLYNYPGGRVVREGLIIAVGGPVVARNSALIERSIADISNAVPKSIVIKTVRSWWPGSGFPNQIRDFNSWELERVLKQGKTPLLIDRIRSWFRIGDA